MSEYFNWIMLSVKQVKSKRRRKAMEYNTIKVVGREVTISLESEGMAYFVNGMRRNIPLNEILECIPWYNSERNARALNRARKLESYNKLQIYDMDLDSDLDSVVCECLRYNTHITHLDIYEAKMMNHQTFDAFCDMLCANTSITSIFFDTFITDAICQVIRTNTTLQQIHGYVSDLHILQSLCQVLPMNRTLHSMSLYIAYSFTLDICKFIAHIIYNNSSLVSLNLGCNNDICEAGPSILMSALQHNSTLDLILQTHFSENDLFWPRTKCLKMRDKVYQLLFCGHFVNSPLCDASILMRVLQYLLMPNSAIPPIWITISS